MMQIGVVILRADLSREGMENPKDEFAIVSTRRGRILFEGTGEECLKKVKESSLMILVS
jgi:hypothetical protein